MSYSIRTNFPVGVRTLTALALLVLIALCLTSCKKASAGHESWTSEMLLRQLVAHEVKPDVSRLDPSSEQTGVAVALITLASDGSLKSVSMLQSPTQEVEAAVTRAVKQWTFNWRGDDPDDVFEGRLTFYVIHSENGFDVLDSNKAPSFARLKPMMSKRVSN